MSIEVFPQATLRKSDASSEKSDHIVKPHQYIRGLKFWPKQFNWGNLSSWAISIWSEGVQNIFQIFSTPSTT